jgi:transcriptional regulator with XRE-family HTH domain
MATDASVTGAKIRRRRQELRLTQEELAERVGVDASSVLNWEAGKHYPKRKLGALESVLGIRLEGDDEPVSPVPAHLRREVYRTLPAEDAERVIRAIEETLTSPAADTGDEKPHRAAG